MKFHQFLKRAMACSEDELKAWISRLERQEIEYGRQPITDAKSLEKYQEIRKHLVILRMELLALKIEKVGKVSE